MKMRGDTLIEVLIGLAVATVAISAITVLGTTSLNNAKFISDQDQASKYAQEGLETVRKIRNSNYTGFASTSGVYCLGKDIQTLGASGSSCTTPNIDGKFIRSVIIVQNGECRSASLAHTTVTVSWTDGKCSAGAYCHTSKLSSCFSTAPPIPAP